MNYPSKPSLQPQHRKITEAPPEHPATSTATDFTNQHLPGAIETNAFPGKSGAKNNYDYLQSKGVVENRLQILEGGIADWPYAEMLVKGR
jgi:hypothetical protein